MMFVSVFTFSLECMYRAIALRVAWIDSRTYRIPNSHLVTMAHLDLIYVALFHPWQRLGFVVISVIGVAIFYFALIATANAIFHKPSMGMGDVKLLMVLSGHLVLIQSQSWPFLLNRVVIFHIVSWSVAAIYAAVIWIQQKRSRNPFAPAIFLALNIAPLVG